MTAETQRVPRAVQFALAGLAAVILGAAGWFLLVSPKRAEAARYEAQTAEVRKEIADRLAASTARQARAAVKTADLFKLAKAMPEGDNMAEIILELNRVAEDAGIIFESITPQGRTAGPQGYQVQPIGLIFRGDFYALSDFLFRLRQLVQVRDGVLTTTGRLFSVDTISFTEDAERRFPYILANLTVHSFVFGDLPLPAASPGAETSTEGGTSTGETTTTEETQTTPEPSDNGEASQPSQETSP